MGKIPTFTTQQKIILDEIKGDDFFQERFYFTGGTALSYVYLQHRESEDLDFFSEKKFDKQTMQLLMEDMARRYSFQIRSYFVEVVFISHLTFADKTKLKVDFSYYPYKRLKLIEQKDGIVAGIP